MERRIHQRFPRRIELRYWRQGETVGHTAYSTNISKSGLFLSSATSLMPAERLRIEIVDSENGFFAEGRVVRVHRVSLALRQVEQQGVGVRFLLPEELIESLVPLARQAGPTTQRSRPVAPAFPGEPAKEPASPMPQSAPLPGDGLTQPQRASDPVPAAAPLVEVDQKSVIPVNFADPSTFLSTYHRDIRAGGLFISTPTPLELSEMLWVELHLPIAGDRPKLFAARVIQRFEPQAAVRPGTNALSGMAVQFLEPERVLEELEPLLAVLRR